MDGLRGPIIYLNHNENFPAHRAEVELSCWYGSRKINYYVGIYHGPDPHQGWSFVATLTGLQGPYAVEFESGPGGALGVPYHGQGFYNHGWGYWEGTGEYELPQGFWDEVVWPAIQNNQLRVNIEAYKDGVCVGGITHADQHGNYTAITLPNWD